MSSVFLVTQGEYSDYGVYAAFSTREAAEAHAAWLNGPEPDGRGAGVEEMDLDRPLPKTGRWYIGGSLQEWLEDEHARGDGWWDPDTTDRTTASRDRDGSIWISAYGKTKAHAIRSGANLARSIKAGTFVVPAPEEGRR